MNLYLVRQNIDHLKGRYFVSAVVVGDTLGQAYDAARKACDTEDPNCEVTFEHDRIRIEKIGDNPPESLEPVGINGMNPWPVLTLVIGEDWDLD